MQQAAAAASWRGWARGAPSSSRAPQRQQPAGPRASAARRRAAAAAVRVVAAERREYYDAKDMPPLPLTVQRITVPSLGYTVVDRSTQQQRLASLAIFFDIGKDDQYSCRLTRRSAITALCMYDRDDVSEARSSPGAFPNIDLLHRVYNEGLDLEFVVEELQPGGAAATG